MNAMFRTLNEVEFFGNLLRRAGIALNGRNPWDPTVHNEKLFTRVIQEGSLGLGEAYMDGWWDCPQLDEFFSRVLTADLFKDARFGDFFTGGFLRLKSQMLNRQTKGRAWEAADVHYNLGDDIFEATFDRRLTGSCAYWSGSAAPDNLDDAQTEKLDLVCRKIGLKSGNRVWDIGCGWGAFMGYAAEKYGASATGVTVSEDQVLFAKSRYASLKDQVEPILLDYRDFKPLTRFDHVVSMGMFEHVGHRNYRNYFECARKALKDDGLFLLHTIWANERSAAIDPWLNKYIFPNGVIPTVGQIATAVEGLFVVEDVHNFGPDYDRTLMAWYEKFLSNRAQIRKTRDERFCRMWEYYLLCCAGGFRSRKISVGQFVLSPYGVRAGYTAVR